MLTLIVANSLALASRLIMLSSGLALIYGLRDVINFGHGALYMLGAYLGYSIARVAGFCFALIAAPILLGLVGVLLEYAVLRPLQRRTHIEVALVTLGLGILVGQAIIYVYGGEARSVDAPASLAGSVSAFGLSYPVYRLFLIGMGLGSCALLAIWLNFTRSGLYVRAVSQDPSVARMMGLNADRLSLLVTILSTAFAGDAGVLAGPDLSVDPGMDVAALALAFALGAFAPTWLADDFALRLANEGLLLGLLALSVAFLMNEAGLVALGAAIVCGGVGYLFAIGLGEGLSPDAALIGAFAVAALYSATHGALVVRSNPLAFMMLTLAAGEMISHGVMLEALRNYTSGADGLVVAFNGTLFGLQAPDYANAAQFWPIAWTAVGLAGLAVFAVRRSRLGAVLRAIRANEERMRFSGFNTYWPRLAGFVFVNLIAAVCGLLHVLNSGFVSPESLGLGVSTNALVAALIGGVAGSVGPILGGVLYVFAQDQFGARGFTQLLTGAGIVVFIVLFPRGIVGGIVRRLAGAGWR